MKRRPLGLALMLALGIAPLPLVAQDNGLLKPFRATGGDATPIPRAIPVDKPIPRAIPVEKPGATPAPSTPAPPKAASPAEPSDPGTITIAPQARGTADQVQLALADSYYKKEKYDQAAPEYERYLGQYPQAPDRATAYFRLGECYRHIGNRNAAKNAYGQLLEQYGSGDFIGPAAFRLADLYYEDKEYRDALVLYRKASVRLKEPVVANAAKFFTGRCLEALGQKLEARVTYEDLVAQPKDNPFFDASRLSLALLLKDSGRTADALKQVQALAKQTVNPDLKLEATARTGVWSLELEPPQTAQADVAFKAALALPGKGYWKEVSELGQVRILSETQKYPQVIEAVEKIGTQISPDVKPELLILLAFAQRQTGKTTEALNTYAQVSKEFPGSVYDKEAQFERLRALYATNDANLVAEIDKYLEANQDADKRDEALLMKAEVLFQKKDYENAMPIYSSLELSRQLTGNRKADALFRLGICQVETKNLEAATKTFSSFINNYPTHRLLAFALLERGQSFQMLKNLAGALKDYETIIKEHPKAPQRELALQQKALIEGQEGNNGAMAASFKQLIKEFPETAARAEADYWIGWAAFEAKNYKEAVPALEEARKIDKAQFGEKAGIRILLSQYYLEDTTGTAREVDWYSKEGKTKVPVEILRWLGNAFYNGGSFESAEKYLKLLTPREEVQPDDFLLLGQSQSEIQRYEEAIGSYSTYLKSTKLPVPRANGLLLLAAAQRGLGRLDDAQKSVDEALQLQPEGEISGKARIEAGMILLAREKPEDAAKIFESVAVILDDPEITPRALELAVKAWRAAGKNDEADKTLNKLKSRYPEYKLKADAQALATPH
jgi:TolA-binding protein